MSEQEPAEPTPDQATEKDQCNVQDAAQNVQHDKSDLSTLPVPKPRRKHSPGRLQNGDSPKVTPPTSPMRSRSVDVKLKPPIRRRTKFKQQESLPSVVQLMPQGDIQQEAVKPEKLVQSNGEDESEKQEARVGVVEEEVREERREEKAAEEETEERVGEEEGEGQSNGSQENAFEESRDLPVGEQEEEGSEDGEGETEIEEICIQMDDDSANQNADDVPSIQVSF